MGVVLLACGLACRFVVNKRANSRNPKHVEAWSMVALALSLVAGVGLAYSFLGEWVAGGLVGITELVSGMTGANVTMAVGLGWALFAILTVFLDVAYDRKADGGAQFAAVVLPVLLALVVGGSIGATGGDAVDAAFGELSKALAGMGGGK